jgi:hypothetical protein
MLLDVILLGFGARVFVGAVLLARDRRASPSRPELAIPTECAQACRH